MKRESLAEHFQHYFQIKLADTEDLLAEAQHLRYRVYCEEFGFEEKSRFPDKRERDADDERSFHALITHRATGQTVATVRLVPSSETTPLPFELHCSGSYDPKIVAPMKRESMCEISRLCVDAQFRRRPGESISQFGNLRKVDLSSDERRLLPFIGISLLLAGTAMTFLTNRLNIFAMMEPFLPKAMESLGICFVQVGKAIPYHGTRALYHVRSESVHAMMQPGLRELFLTLYHQLRPLFVSPAPEQILENLRAPSP
jgi:N-acyl amino acid synthase of PEP-CTERM/exosortase system